MRHDKVGFFLNAYLQLGVAPHSVSFRKIWYDKGEAKHGVLPQLRSSQNWALQGLFWLSKELYAKGEAPISVLEPDARELDAIRNHVEHKYLKLHLEHAATARREGDLFYDGLSFSMNREDFEAKTLKVMKLARAALIYLAMAVTAAETAEPGEEGAYVLPPPRRVRRWLEDLTGAQGARKIQAAAQTLVPAACPPARGGQHSCPI